MICLFLGFMAYQTMPNPFYTYTLNIHDLTFFRFYGISNIEGYLMPNPLYTYDIEFINA